jgi:ribonuclease HII
VLKSSFSPDLIEAGCDEAGRGCLAGPVFAAAVILPKDYRNEFLDDSKKLSARQRYCLRPIIETQAIAWAVSSVSAPEIDDINILRASILAMHKALKALSVMPQLLLIDGNRFTHYEGIPHRCIVKGDGEYMSIAAASVLAKTYRDDFMMTIHQEYPLYNWNSNKGYPSKLHRERIIEHGICPYHRRSFNLTGQMELPFN